MTHTRSGEWEGSILSYETADTQSYLFVSYLVSYLVSWSPFYYVFTNISHTSQGAETMSRGTMYTCYEVFLMLFRG